MANHLNRQIIPMNDPMTSFSDGPGICATSTEPDGCCLSRRGIMIDIQQVYSRSYIKQYHTPDEDKVDLDLCLGLRNRFQHLSERVAHCSFLLSLYTLPTYLHLG